MKRNQNLSPKKYIQTRARMLPLYKCYVSKGWQEAGIANVVVTRRHVNGNVTAGIYLVDLMCLGIKDTFYFFNEPEGELNEKIGMDQQFLDEIDYNLAHNIIYTGHDFAAEYQISPHKDFSVSRFILQEDSETIPLIDVHTGDENGNPVLLDNGSGDYDYRAALKKLERYAGEGNYTFLIADNEDVDWADGYGDENDEEDFDDIGGDEDDGSIEHIEPGFIDFDKIRNATEEELEEVSNDPTRPISDFIILNTAMLIRDQNETEPGWLKDEEEITGSDDFKLYEKKIELNKEASGKNEDIITAFWEEFQEISPDAASDTNPDSPYLALFNKYHRNEIVGFSALNTIPLLTTTLSLGWLQNNSKEYLPAIQLIIAAFSLALQQEQKQEFDFITKAPDVENAFPGNEQIHALHHKIFWVVKALQALHNDDEERMKHYHSLLTITGIGGTLKMAYAMRLTEWLESR